MIRNNVGGVLLIDLALTASVQISFMCFTHLEGGCGNCAAWDASTKPEFVWERAHNFRVNVIIVIQLNESTRSSLYITAVLLCLGFNHQCPCHLRPSSTVDPLTVQTTRICRQKRLRQNLNWFENVLTRQCELATPCTHRVLELMVCRSAWGNEGLMKVMIRW